MVLTVQRHLNLPQLLGSVGEKLVVNKYAKLEGIRHDLQIFRQRYDNYPILANDCKTLCEKFRNEKFRKDIAAAFLLRQRGEHDAYLLPLHVGRQEGLDGGKAALGTHLGDNAQDGFAVFGRNDFGGVVRRIYDLPSAPTC